MKTLRAFYWIALVNFLLTVCMVLLGAYVKNSGSSLACPDWPTCFGTLMPEMKGGVAIEHSHRILGSILGLLTIGLTFLSFKHRSAKPTLFWGSCLALVLVIFQGILGGVTVLKQISPHVSTVHLITSQIYLAILLWLCLKSRFESAGIIHFNQINPKITKWLNIAIAIFLIQVILGAIVRHSGAGVACGLGWQSALKCLNSVTGEPTWWPDTLLAKVQMKHKFWGFFTSLALVGSTMPFLKWAKRNHVRSIRLAIVGIHITLLLQIVVGMMAIGTSLSNHSVLTHVFLAMVIWSFLIFLRFKAHQLKGKTT
ncbi:hypothetical protein GW915_10395 [bacterium]|nr:hypothetical protein [bacterium]